MNEEALNQWKNEFREVFNRISVLNEELTRILQSPPTPSVLSPQFSMFNVPFLSQWGPDANRSPRDCGPACVAMVAKYFGRKTTVDETAVLCGQDPSKYTSFQQMYAGLRAHDINYEFARLTPEIIEESLRNGRPVIALVHYGALPGRRIWPPDRPFTGAHFIVITSCERDISTPRYAYNDPYYPSKDGHGLFIAEKHLLQALEQVVQDSMAYPNQGIICGD